MRGPKKEITANRDDKFQDPVTGGRDTIIGPYRPGLYDVF